MQNFNVVNENSEFKMGSAISVFKLPNDERKILLFSVEELDVSDDASLQVAYLNTDEEGYDYLVPIDNSDTFKKAMMVVKDIMRVVNNE